MTTATTLTAISSARASGKDVGLAAFLSTASEDELRLASVLSVSISSTLEAACQVSEQVWPDFHSRAALALSHRSFVGDVAQGVCISERWAAAISEHFRSADPEAFARVHRLLVNTETALLELEDDDENRWFIRGRTAFYLAGIDPRQSVEVFGEVFTTPPLAERTARRLWLSSLVVRQRSLLHEMRRELAFFRGFSSYVAGNYPSARVDFEDVTSTNDGDRFRAVALHLLGSMRRGQPGAIALLRESVELSMRLNIRENEVMARHSLAWALVAELQAKADDRPADTDIESIARLARLNARRAEESGDVYLIAWCSRSSAEIDWLSLTNFRSTIGEPAREAAREIISRLRAAAETAQSFEDFETAALATNDIVGIWRDLGDVDTAIAVANEFLDTIAWRSNPPNALSSLAKTLGSLQGLVTDSTQADNLRDARQRIAEPR